MHPRVLGPLWAARFEPPATPATAVVRRRLLFLLELAVQQKLTTVVAPTGYGKTVLLGQWARSHQGHRVRWLTLSQQHNDRGVLMGAVSEALGVQAEVGSGRLDGGSLTAHPTPVRVVDLALLERLERLPPTALVIDDYQQLTDPVGLDELATLIEHSPRVLRFVIASQVDPPPRYYHPSLSEELVEIRQSHLAFTWEEATDLVVTLAGVRLTDDRIGRLVRGTEGWGVALHLAALSLRGGADADELVATFGSHDGSIADYLTEHVLSHLPGVTIEFLLRTSVVEQMTGSLCDALTGRTGSQAVLDDLLRRSLLVSVEEPGSGWYRYHQLFRTVLRGRLRESDRSLEPELLRTAAGWHIGRGELDTGLRYLAQAGAWGDLLATVADFSADMLDPERARSMAAILAGAPARLRVENPSVRLVEAAGWALGGRSGAAGRVLTAMEEDGPPPRAHLVMGQLIRAYAALRSGRARDAVEGAEEVLRSIRERDVGEEPGGGFPDVLGLAPGKGEIASAAEAVRGAGLVYEGSLESGREALERSATAAHPMWRAAALGWMALADAWSGRLTVAERTGRRAVLLSRRAASDLMAPAACIALATVARERGDMEQARSWLHDADLAEATGTDRAAAALVVIEQALLAGAEGRPSAGLTALEADRSRSRRYRLLPEEIEARWCSAEARLLLASGEAAAATHSLRSSPRRTSDVLSVEVQMAVERLDLDRARVLIGQWPDGPAPRAGIERALWLAVVDHLSGRSDLARTRLAEAVGTCSAEGWLGVLRPAPVVSAARVLYRESPTPFLREVCDSPVVASAARTVKGLVEQLTEREYMVLPLLPTRMTNLEIAETLGVSLNTVKTHLKHIYRKLGVTERSDAIAVAEELHLW